jgi:hypothetical protein
MPVVFDPFSFFTFAFLLSQDLSGSKVTSNQVHILLSLCLFKRKKELPSLNAASGSAWFKSRSYP